MRCETAAVFRLMSHERETLDPTFIIEGDPFFIGGWGIANEGAKLPPECCCPMFAEQLCAAANAQGLSATLENIPSGEHAMCSPELLTICWPDASG